MLPPSLYFSEEFRLMNAQQLRRGVAQAALTDSEHLLQALMELELSLSSGDEPPAAKESHRHDATIALPSPRVLTTEQATHRFNIYLNAIEQSNSGDSVLVDPFSLQGNCSVEAIDLLLESLVRKLAALAQIAQERDTALILALPSETQLESWLKILQRLLEVAPSDAKLGIELSAASKRLLPTLGYLEKLTADLTHPLFVRLYQCSYLSPQPWPFANCQPHLESTNSIHLNLMTACAFLESENNSGLTPALILQGPTIEPNLAALCEERGWRIDLLEASSASASETGETIQGAPCLHEGLTIVSERLNEITHSLRAKPMHGKPVIGSQPKGGSEPQTINHPGAVHDPIGEVQEATEDDTREAFALCTDAQIVWRDQAPYERHSIIERFTQLLCDQQLEVALIGATETGKPLKDLLEETRQGIQLIRQHLRLSTHVLSSTPLSASPGRTCTLTPHPLGTLLALLPWSQPIFQFCATTSAALLMGNALLIKPASRATLVSAHLYGLLLQAGLPANLTAFLPGSLESTGHFLLDDYRLDGVMFCGNPSAAAEVYRRLTRRVGAPPLPLLTDTGGRHLAIVDSDQDLNQILPRLIEAAFRDNGQNPGSLRVAYVEESIADRLEQMLKQALLNLRIGPPEHRATDIGPLITRDQMDRAYLQIERFRTKGRLIAHGEIRTELEEGYYVPPALLRLYSLDELQEQIDGPLLYIVRFNRDQIRRVTDEINRSGFAIALSLFTDDTTLSEHIEREARLAEYALAPSSDAGCAYPPTRSGVGLSGTTALPGTADYLKALARFQRASRPESLLDALD